MVFDEDSQGFALTQLDETNLDFYKQRAKKLQDMRRQEDYARFGMTDRAGHDTQQMRQRQSGQRQDRGVELFQDSQGVGKYTYQDLAALTAKAGKLQKRIDKEYKIEDMDNWFSKGRVAFRSLIQRAGGKIKSLNDFLDEEKKLVGEVCKTLTSIERTTEFHYRKLDLYRVNSSVRLSKMIMCRPGLVLNVIEGQKRIADLKSRFRRISPQDPDYPIMRCAIMRNRDYNDHGCNTIATNDSTYALIDQLVVHVDSAANFLLHGRDSVHDMSEKYRIMYEALVEIQPALIHAREMYNNRGRIQELRGIMSGAYGHAFSVQQRLENPEILARVYQNLPALEIQGGVFGSLDQLNNAMAQVKVTWR